MRITADTNLLVRYTMFDDPGQAEAARTVIDEAETVCVPVTALCEYVWVLRSGFRLKNSEIEQTLKILLGANNVLVDQFIVGKGLAMLEKGGDFADGVIAFEGQWLGGDEFVTFDRKAATLLPQIGIPTRCLTSE